ncbi:DUF805 domain-containing protein [Gemmobacter aquarius]|uniref:DUF805 domain-containing protein n=1 Tax=Paragemmobacter aquarius TaxID=2169400 RepID=A0A2S0UIA0_9RHOB|nr:DUF805 domain-containing protein [Gemmobacter aquarius]AWB47543.1 DUF805 domain-containing protein [Gemmobacter aquarius]
MNMIQAVKSVFSNYATFSGRASRSEFWWWVLFSIIVSGILTYIDLTLLGSGDLQSTAGDGGIGFSLNLGLLGGLWTLATVLPAIALGARRLHDVGQSGWMLLLSIVPLLGWIVLLVFTCKRGSAGTNRFGADPITTT